MAKKNPKNRPFIPQNPSQTPVQPGKKDFLSTQEFEKYALETLAQQAHMTAENLPLEGKKQAFETFMDQIDQTGPFLDQLQSKVIGQPLHREYLSKLDLSLVDAINYFHKNSVKKMFDAETEKIITQAYVKKMDQKAQKTLGNMYPQFQTLVSSQQFSKLSDLDLALQNMQSQLSLTSDQNDTLYDVKASNNDILTSAVKEKYVAANHDVNGQTIDNMPPKFKGFINNLVKLQVADGLKDHTEFVKAGMNEIKKLFVMPTLGDLLKKFPSDDATLRQAAPDFDEQIKALGDDGDNVESYKLHCFIKSIEQKDPELGSVMAGLYSNAWNASKLSKSDQKTLLDRLKKQKLDDPELVKIQDFLQISPDGFKDMINDLFDVDKKTLTLTTKNGPLTLNFKDKTLLGNDQLSMKSIRDAKQADVVVNFTLDGAHKDVYQEYIDPSKSGFFARGDQQLHPSYKIKLTDQTGKSIEGYPTLRRDGNNQNSLFITLTDKPTSHPGTKTEILTIPADQKDQYTPEILSKQFDLDQNDLSSLMMLHAAAAGTTQMSDQEIKKSLEEYQQKKLDTMNKDITQSLIKPEDKKNITPEKKESETIAFLERWNQFEGEKVEFKEGVEIMVSIPKSDLNFDKNWKGDPHPYLTFKIEKVDFKKGIFKATYKSPWMSGNSTKEFPMSTEFLDILEGSFTSKGEKLFTGQIFKFSGKNKNAFIEAIQGGKYTFEDTHKSVKDFVTYLNNEIDLKTGNKKHSTDEKGKTKITYFGRIGQDFDPKESKLVEVPLMYKVEMNADDVKVTHTDGKHSFTLSYQDFLLFAGEQGLRGYTDHEAEVFNKRFTDPQPGPIFGGTPLKWFSIGDLISGWKKVQGNIKEHFEKKAKEQEKEFQYRLFSSKLIKGLSRLPFGYGDAFEDMSDDYINFIDNDIQKEIAEHQKSFKKENMSGGAALGAVWEFMEKEGGYRKKPRKVAGALFFMMENGGIYQKKFAGKKGLWVNRLLGPEYEAHFKSYYASIEAEARAFPENRKELNDKLKRAEVEFIIAMLNGEGAIKTEGTDEFKFKIAGQESWKYQFGTKMTGNLTVALNNMHSKSNIEKAKTDLDALPSFFLRYNEFKNALSGFQKNNIIAGVEKMAEKIDNNTQYNQWSSCMLACLVTPALLTTADGNVDTGAFKGVAANYKFLLGNFIDDMNAPEKVTKLLDIISKKAGIPVFSQQFKSPLSDASKVDANFGLIEQWRASHGTIVMEYLNLKNIGEKNNLINLWSSPESDLTFDEKNIVRQYLDIVEKDDSDMFNDVVGERPNYSQGIWLMNESFINSMRFGTKNDFPGNPAQSKKNRKLRDSLAKTTQSLKNTTATSESFNFVLRTYRKWFHSKYSGNQSYQIFGLVMKELKNGIATRESLKWGFSNIIRQFNQNATLPASVMKVFESFEEFFWNNREKFKTLDIEKMFGEEGNSIAQAMNVSKFPTLQSYIDDTSNKKLKNFQTNTPDENSSNQIDFEDFFSRYAA